MCYCFNDVNVVDVAGPAQAFSTARVNCKSVKDTRYVSTDGKSARASCSSTLTPGALTGSNVRRADNHPIPHDLLIPNRTGVDEALENLALKNLIKDWHLHHPGGRIASVCSGVFLMANASILNGKLATNHWSRQTQIIHQFPTSDVD